MKSLSNYTVALIAALLLLPLIISNQSFWMDECGTALYGLEPTLNAWWQRLNHDGGGDCQMPLSLFFAWLTGHAIGSHEWQFRATNLLWGAFAIVGMYRAGKRLQLPWLPLLLAIQPYFWFYTNEARSYALELACGAWLFAALTCFIDTQGKGKSWPWEFSIGAVLLCATTMLAPLPILITLMAGTLLAVQGKWRIQRRQIAVLLGAGIASVPIGIYYVSTLLRGAQGAQLWRVKFNYFAYVVYEVTGMVGLGPRIDTIREFARSSHVYAELIKNGSQFLLPFVCSLLLLLIVVFGLRKWRTKPQVSFLVGYTIVLVTTSLIFIVVGVALQKAFWGRHFAPVVPFYVALLGMMISRVYEAKKLRFLVFCFIGLLIYSSLSLRFAVEYQKENYRAAANVARSALTQHKTVWWSAASLGAQYYGLDCATNAPETGKVFCPVSADLTRFPLPDVIVYSKPDVFDRSGIVANIIQQNGYRKIETLNVFVVWEK